MCVYSMVSDHFSPVIPLPTTTCALCGQAYTGIAHVCPKITPIAPTIGWPWSPPLAPEDLRKLLEGFKDARRCAELVDELTKQKDCVDPEKAKLGDRVAELERRLADVEVELSKRVRRAPKKKAKAN